MKIYLCHPISGGDYETINAYYTQVTDTLEKAGWVVFSPMIGKGYLRTELKFRAHGYGQPLSKDHAIFERDKWMVTQSDVVYANLVGAKFTSLGTVMELAWASFLGKHTIVAMEEGNPHEHAFIFEAADVVFPSHVEAMDYLVTLIQNLKG